MLKKSTEAQYATLFRALSLRYLREGGARSEDETETPAGRFTEWLLERVAPSVTPNTWRLYRAACVHGLRARHDEDAALALAHARATPRARARSSDPRARGAARRSRRLTQSDLDRLHAELRPARGGLDHVLRAWLEAGRLTGLRPSEWRTAHLETDEAGVARLVVRNAKRTLPDAPETRALVLAGLTDSDRAILDYLLAAIAPHRDDDAAWAGLLRAVTTRLNAVTRRLWPRRPRRPTLYSARHQFAADAKASGLPLEEIAALLGQASSETAARFYGRRRDGRRDGRRSSGGFRVRAPAEAIARVRSNHRVRPPRPSRAPTGRAFPLDAPHLTHLSTGGQP